MSQVTDIRNRLSEKRARDIVALRDELERLRAALDVIASGEFETLDDAIKYANTCVLASRELPL